MSAIEFDNITNNRQPQAMTGHRLIQSQRALADMKDVSFRTAGPVIGDPYLEALLSLDFDFNLLIGPFAGVFDNIADQFQHVFPIIAQQSVGWAARTTNCNGFSL